MAVNLISLYNGLNASSQYQIFNYSIFIHCLVFKLMSIFSKLLRPVNPHLFHRWCRGIVLCDRSGCSYSRRPCLWPLLTSQSPTFNQTPNLNSSTSLTSSQCYAQTHFLRGPSCERATCNNPKGHLPVPSFAPLCSFPPLSIFLPLRLSLHSSILTHFPCSSSPGPAEPLIPHTVLILPHTHICVFMCLGGVCLDDDLGGS